MMSVTTSIMKLEVEGEEKREKKGVETKSL